MSAYSNPTFHVRFDCAVHASRKPVREMVGFLKGLGFDAVGCSAWEVALQEGVNNAILHCQKCCNAHRQALVLEAVAQSDYVEVVLHDHTQGFVWPKASELPAEQRESGRGVYMIQHLVDYSDYLRGTQSNRLILRKNRPRAQAFELGEKTTEELTGYYQQKLDEADKALLDMHQELSSCYESLSAIFKFGADLGKLDGIRNFTDRLLSQLITIMEADCYIIRTIDSTRTFMVTYSRSSTEFNLPPIKWGVDGGSQLLESRAITNRKDILLDTRGDSLDPDDPLNVFKANCILVHPIQVGEELIGVLSVGASHAKEPFTSFQTNVMHTFADFLALQLIIDSGQEERIEFGRISKELDIARDIQNSLLPHDSSDFDGFSLAGECISSSNISGDFFDVIPLGRNRQKVLLVIADVMGKGVPASIFAAIFRSLVRASVELFERPAELMQKLHRVMYDDLSGVDMFITAQLAFCDLEKRVMRVSNAGHCPLLLSHTGTLLPSDHVAPDGYPLGVFKHPEVDEIELNIPKGCRMLMYTDGLVETSEEMIGKESAGQKRLSQWFEDTRNSEQKAAAFRTSLKRLLKASNENQLRDDQTFILLVEN
jgi:serine phosphatase RsbU (regulator of sigma subunit)/anti-sigma regulatory factor (Ser/Thr protein kinase)